ncbi:hypothetical protein [Niveibacterium sp. SC-1]|uniref:hypothetical protein n=1 Tax=Niveibacterium sp. SC-1 TaxID=3135646 RepID=UPI00311DEA2A
MQRSAGTWLFVACSVWLIGLGGYFIFVRPPLLPEDLAYAGANAVVLQTAAPRITEWLDLVFTVMGGFMAGTGVLVLYLALQVMPQQPKGLLAVMALVGALTVGLMSAVNFALHSDFRWLLVGPPVLWLAAVLVLSGSKTWTGDRSTD